MAVFASVPAMAQSDVSTLNENINNQGIPRQAPSLGLSSIYGLNPCSSGLSVGVTTPLFGIGGAAATIDKECETRNNAALAVTALHDQRLAREIMCKIHEVRQAAIRVHQPCIEDGGVARVSMPQGSPAPGALATPTAVPGTAAVPRQYAPAMPMRIPPRTPGMETDSSAQVPAFCRTPDLVKTAYPECVPGSAAAQAAMAPPRPVPRGRVMVVNSEPAATQRPRPPEHVQAAVGTARRPEPPILAEAARPTTNCTVPSALRAVYPECGSDARAGEAAQGTEASHGTDRVRTVAGRQPILAEAARPTASCTVPSALRAVYPECGPGTKAGDAGERTEASRGTDLVRAVAGRQ